MKDTNAIVQFLEELTSADFSRILARLPEADKQIPQNVSHLERVFALMRYVDASGGPGRKKLQGVVAALFPNRTGIVTNIPTSDPVFVGRKTELTLIKKWAQQKVNPVLCLHGPGGVGKTRLAIKAAARIQDEFSVARLISLDRLEEEKDKTVKSLLFYLAKELNYEFHNEEAEKERLNNEEVVEKLTKRLVAYLSWHNRVLLILDNFETIDSPEMQNWVATRLVAPGIYCLVTSRHEFSVQNIAQNLPVSVMDLADAQRLFYARLPKSDQLPPFDKLSIREQQALHRILQVTDGLPLAIQMVASNLPGWREENQEALLSQDKSEAGWLEVLADTTNPQSLVYESTTSGNERQNGMKSCFLWSLKFVPEKTGKTYPELSIFPSDFNSEAALQICGVSKGELKELARCSLLQKSQKNLPGRYFLLSLQKEYCRELITHAEPLKDRYIAYFTDVDRWTIYGAAADFENISYAFHLVAEHSSQEDFLRQYSAKIRRMRRWNMDLAIQLYSHLDKFLLHPDTMDLLLDTYMYAVGLRYKNDLKSRDVFNALADLFRKTGREYCALIPLAEIYFDSLEDLTGLLERCDVVEHDADKGYDLTLARIALWDLILQNRRRELMSDSCTPEMIAQYQKDTDHLIALLDEVAQEDRYKTDYMRDIIDVAMLKSICRTNVGISYRMTGDYDKAIQQFESAIQNYQSMEGVHPNINNNRFFIIETLFEQLYPVGGAGKSGSADDVAGIARCYREMQEIVTSDTVRERKADFIREFNELLSTANLPVEKRSGEKLYLRNNRGIYSEELTLLVNDQPITVKAWGAD